MLKAMVAATAALTLMSGVVLADDVETTRQSTGIGPLKFETDKTVRTNDSDHDMRTAGQMQIEKDKTVTKDWDGDTKTKTETTTIR